jgi:glycosyltransferase involved in cell wall biosynthesis
MRIAINLLYLIPGVVGGTQTYAVSLLRALARIDGVNQYAIFLNRESAGLPLPEAPNFRRIVCGVRAVSRPLRYAYEQMALPVRLWHRGIDVVHSPGYVCPLVPPCASVVTICDVNFVAMREIMPQAKQRFLGFFVRQSARRADHILTLSEFSKGQIAAHVKSDVSNVTVTRLGPREAPPDARVAWEDIADRYRIRKPYAVAFGGSPHKNIARLIQAFGQIQADVPQALVLLGHLSAGLETQAAAAGASGRVVMTGYVPDEHVAPLLANAQLLVFPSWYEGFGLPVLDAQSLGVPVACSRVASLPEVAGDGATYFDPLSVDDMAGVMRTCLLDADLRMRLAEKGRANAARFSWDETARQTLDVYRAVATRSDR